MDAVAERDVTFDGAVDAELAGVVAELAGIAIGGRPHQRHLRARGNGDAAHLDVARGGAGELMDRPTPSEHLLDGVGEQRTVGSQRGELVAMIEQREQAVADQVGGGLGARDEQHEAEPEDLGVGEALAVDLGREQLGDEVVGRLSTAGFDDLGGEARQRCGGVAPRRWCRADRVVGATSCRPSP